jgi:hypothetical protein
MRRPIGTNIRRRWESGGMKLLRIFEGIAENYWGLEKCARGLSNGAEALREVLPRTSGCFFDDSSYYCSCTLRALGDERRIFSEKTISFPLSHHNHNHDTVGITKEFPKWFGIFYILHYALSLHFLLFGSPAPLDHNITPHILNGKMLVFLLAFRIPSGVWSGLLPFGREKLIRFRDRRRMKETKTQT